ncbi:MLP-like protein 423 [Curcuma longa]|uniref:MLP-like protein 423 n=1 Tax=Curcuma longa TaxID=136217 RepID=UPI003D9ECBC7
MACKTELDVEVKSSTDKMWEAIRDSTKLFPKIFPELYESIETVEGDGKSAGTIRLLKYAPGVKILTFAKERIDLADDENKHVSYTVIDGEIVSLYKTFRAILKVEGKGEGSVVKWCIEYEKVNEEVPDPDPFKEIAAKTFSDLDEYLIKNSIES